MTPYSPCCSRRIQNIHETAHFYDVSDNKPSLTQALQYHVEQRLTDIFYSLVRIHGMAHPEDEIHCRVWKAVEQGPRSERPEWHSSHSSMVSNIRIGPHSLIQLAAQRVQKSGQFSPCSKRILQSSYRQPEETLLPKILSGEPLVHPTHSLLHGRHGSLRQVCVLLPRWINLVVDARLERCLRPSIAPIYVEVAKGGSIFSAMDRIARLIHTHFKQAAAHCTQRKRQLQSLGKLEERVLLMVKRAREGRGQDPRLAICLRNIQDLQHALQARTSTAPISGVPLLTGQLVRIYARHGIASVWKRVLNGPKQLSISKMSDAAIRSKRQAKIAYFENLRWANALCAKETLSPIGELLPIDRLLPRTPEKQKDIKLRMIDQRPPTETTPEKFPQKEVTKSLPTPIKASDYQQWKENLPPSSSSSSSSSNSSSSSSSSSSSKRPIRRSLLSELQASIVPVT